MITVSENHFAVVLGLIRVSSGQIILIAAITTILTFVLAIIDFFFNRWKHFAGMWHWIRALLRRYKQDTSPVVLRIPASPLTSAIPVSPPGGVTGELSGGVSKHLIKHIMSGTRQQLMAFEIVHQGFPGVRFLVERVVPKVEPESFQTPDRDKANAKWQEWYTEWKKQPGGFGGSFGTGLDGKLPW
jgi:hypothetical protein